MSRMSEIAMEMLPLRTIDRVEALEMAVIEAIEFIEQYSDIVDGPDGIPFPNAAMSLLIELRKVLEGK